MQEEVKLQPKASVPYDSSDEESKASSKLSSKASSKPSSKQSFKKICISQTKTQLTETKMPNYAYENEEVLHNSYLLPQVIDMGR